VAVAPREAFGVGLYPGQYCGAGWQRAKRIRGLEQGRPTKLSRFSIHHFPFLIFHSLIRHSVVKFDGQGNIKWQMRNDMENRYLVLKYLVQRMALGKKAMFIFKFIIAPAALLVALVALRVYTYGNKAVDVKADAAIVLGAAVWGDEVSPVFRERINHALELYRTGKVGKIIFTGGQGNRNELTEAAAARHYAIKNGIPERDILIEESSHTTYENVVNAKHVADANGLKKVLIVSDPMHMRRAVTMAGDVGLEAYPSPTPTTKYQGWKSQMVSLADETYHYIGYLAGKVFNYELPVNE
jgi:uncharacterized SAM-binding protein YcdF (DUF218 family)